MPWGWLSEHARAREEAGLRRTLTARPVDHPLLDLASNDYLSLARDPRVVAAAVAATSEWGAGATASRLVTGTIDVHIALEAALTELTGAASALVFSSGYLANIGVITALAPAGTRVLSDERNHASIIDACRLSRAEVVVYPHRDVAAVTTLLAEGGGRRTVVVTDGVFSVDGQRAPLQELHAACREHAAALVVDEAHAIGVIGPGGAGAVAAAGLAGEPDVVLTATLSKALAAQGGVVLGAPEVTAHLIDTARTMIFDTGLAPAATAAALAATRILLDEPDLATQVRSAAARLHALARQAGWDCPTPEGGVVALPVGSPGAARAAQRACAEAGVEVGCFRPPSVPDGVSRLRLTARAGLTEGELATTALALAAARDVAVAAL